LVIPLSGKKSLKIRRKTCFTDWHCPQPLSKKIKLRAYRYSFFLQRTPLDRNLPQAKLFNRSNLFFFCLKGRGPLKEVKKIAEM
jgi:hypothetical protein